MKTLLVAALIVAAPLPPMVKMALNEATLHLNSGQFAAAERVLKDLKQRLWLLGSPEAGAVKVKVEFVLWDLRMGLHEQARKDLKAVVELVAAPAPAAPPGARRPLAEKLLGAHASSRRD